MIEQLQESYVLTTLPLVFKGGERDGECHDWASRFVDTITFGFHNYPRASFYETYARTIQIDPANGFTVFQCVERRMHTPKRLSWLRRVLLWVGFVRPNYFVIE